MCNGTHSVVLQGRCVQILSETQRILYISRLNELFSQMLKVIFIPLKKRAALKILFNEYLKGLYG
jgi:hypothetical protein